MTRWPIRWSDACPAKAKGQAPVVSGRAQPVQPRLGRGAGRVFRADPAAIARGPDGVQKLGKVDVAPAWLVSAGPVCDLDMTHMVGHALPDGKSVTMDHLGLIHVELQSQ